VPAPPPPPQPLGAYLRLVAIAAAIGIPAALVGAGFLDLVQRGARRRARLRRGVDHDGRARAATARSG
jgi:hypothetical protein